MSIRLTVAAALAACALSAFAEVSVSASQTTQGGPCTVTFKVWNDGLEHLTLNEHPVQLVFGQNAKRAEGLKEASFYDDCDRTGKLVVQVLPRDLKAARDIMSAVRNHPSVIAWEAPVDVPAVSQAVLRDDPDRPLTWRDDPRLVRPLPPRVVGAAVPVWKDGDDGVKVYRIPALCTAPNGDLVAVADARKDGWPDLFEGNPIWTVIRRSSDNGKTWTKSEKVWDWPWTDKSKMSASDPSLVVDERNKKIFLFYNVMDFVQGDCYRFFVQESSDNGKTWTKPREITQEMARPDWPVGKSEKKDNANIFIPSGSGTQLKDGTLVHTFTWCSKSLVALFASKDGGKTWGPMGQPFKAGNECKVVELADGSLMINSRYGNWRFVIVSHDRGETWKRVDDGGLIDPMCNAQIMRAGKHLIFSHCNSVHRRNLYVRASSDEGKSWNRGLCITPDGAAYSDLTVLRNGDIGVLYEGVGAIEFVYVPADKLFSAGGALVFSDEFDGDLVDETKWDYERGFIRNHEPQWYQPQNASVAKGALVIEARKERVENPDYVAGAKDDKRDRPFANYTSASLNTWGKFAFQYGRVEVRAKVPHGRSAWPAIWTLGDNRKSVSWPKCGEIDIMEYWGKTPDDPMSCLHFFTPTSTRPKGHMHLGPFHCPGSKTTDRFHVYALDWTSERMTFSFDGKPYATVPVGQFDLPDGSNAFRTPHYLLLNLALTGRHEGNDDFPAADKFPMRYEIDYVRIYAP